MSGFELSKYLGVWYELIHYPSWFQRNDNYNTVAQYGLANDGSISVRNSTITQGKYFESVGTAHNLRGTDFRVDFPIPEIAKLANSHQFNVPQFSLPQSQVQSQSEINYVIDRIWVNRYGQYIFAVVTDPARQSLYLLSRYPNPSLVAYNEIMAYIIANYDRDRLVQTPHFK